MDTFVGRAPRGRRRRSLFVRAGVASLGLASLATIHTADAQTKTTTTSTICSQPVTAENCKQARFRDCKGMKEQCTPILQSGFQSAYSGQITRPSYQYLDDKNAIVHGKLQSQSLSDADTIATGGLSGYAALEARAQADAQKASVTPSPFYTRNQSWADTKAINSCAEYVYEKYYSYMRFVDAANSCKQDERCVVDAAYGKGALLGIFPSNIVDVPPYGRGASGNVPLPPIPLKQGVVPKNGFYLGAVLLSPKVRQLLEASHPTWKATLDEIAARAYGGTNYYKWGSPSVYGVPPVKTFPDEFEFHKQMRATTATVPLVEARANIKRTEHFERLFADWVAMAQCHGLNGALNCQDDHLPLLRQHGVLESIGGDPWIRTHILANGSLRTQAVALALQGKAAQLDATGATLTSLDFNFNPVTVQGLEPIGGGSLGGSVSNLTGGSILGDGPIAVPLDPTILLPTPDPEVDPTPLWANGVGLDLNNEWTADPLVPDAASATPRFDCTVEASKSTYRHLACEATNAMLDEIARDNVSCFDKGYAGCDWDPAMFAERFHRAQLYMPQRSADYERCMRWTSDAFPWVPAAAKANYEALEDYIDQVSAAFVDFDAPRQLGLGGKVVKFGQSKSDSVELGSRDSFGGGYSYLAAWGSKPYRASNGTICRMDFTADAEFKAWGSALGLRKDFVDMGAHLRVNKNDDGLATFDRKLIVAALSGGDAEIIPYGADIGINVAAGQTPHVIIQGEEKDIEIFSMTYPLPYGFYVDIEAGVELSAGAMFMAGAKVPAKQACTGTGPQELAALAELRPQATASLYGSTSGGWLGIVEAGLEAELDLINVSLPVTASAAVVPGTSPKLKYDLEGKMRLTTLGGRVEACGCFLVFCGCTEVVSWPGQKVATSELFSPVHGEADLIAF